jgi:hypothetical protein
MTANGDDLFGLDEDISGFEGHLPAIQHLSTVNQ